MEIKSTQIRIPLPLAGYIEAEAERLGVSLNSVMLILMDDGKRLREAYLNADLTVGLRHHMDAPQ